jgi:beta-lactam-binding protein with PASTA domain
VDHPQYDPTPCPVQVPDNLGGMTGAQAHAALQAIGLGYAEGEPFPVNQPELVGTVRAHDPGPGIWVPAASTVTVRIGVLAEP